MKKLTVIGFAFFGFSLLGLNVSVFAQSGGNNLFKPYSNLSNAEIIGNIQATFEAQCPNTVITESVKNNTYIRLLEAAKNEYHGNIDVCDITVVKLENISWARNIFKLAATGKVVLIGGGGRAMANTGIEGALARAAQETLKNVPQRSKIAIVYITAQDRSTTDYIAGELEYIWVNDGFTIIDRSQLDRIRQEQNFQLSGEVDDATAVSIGKFAGANIIVTGRVDGEGNLRRLRLRALDTQTAQVVGVSSERL
ncbi:CsgG/HfaB family protein [Treponema sp. R80B11-R83G3]